MGGRGTGHGDKRVPKSKGGQKQTNEKKNQTNQDLECVDATFDFPDSTWQLQLDGRRFHPDCSVGARGQNPAEQDRGAQRHCGCRPDWTVGMVDDWTRSKFGF